MPEISVCIPTHNRRERLRACLDSLAAQTAEPERFEVVVCVDGSSDGTEEMLRALSTPFELRVVVQPQGGQSAAINGAAGAATAPTILILDDDMVASPELVAAHLSAHSSGDAVAAIGRIARRLPQRIDAFARHRARAWDAHYERLAARPVRATDCYSGNLSLPRTLFAELGGFATDFPVEKDMEFAQRLAKAGPRFVYVPEAVATEDQREDWREICRDAESRGFQNVELYRRHPEILATSRLGGHEAVGRRAALLRRVLLAARVPASIPALVGLALRGERADRVFDFAYTYAYWRGVRNAAGSELRGRLARGTLVLLYHAVGADGEDATRYVVPRRRLRAQLRWLRRLGYTTIGLDELLRCRRANELPPAKAVVITFDDGYRDNAELLAPLLAEAGAEATVFLVAGAGAENGWSEGGGLRGRPLLSPAEAAALEPGPLRFGAHTVTHPRLTELHADGARAEVAGSKHALEAALGRPVELFAYPYGAHDGPVRALVAQSGFALACTIEQGRNRPATDPLALKRVEVYGTDGLVRFLLTVWLGRRPRRRR